MPWDLTVTLPDEPGELAHLGEALGAAGVNIEGACAVTAGATGTIHLLVDDMGGAKDALTAAGIEIAAEQEVLVVDCVDEPGAMGERARKLADAGINVSLFYLASRTRLVFGTDDPARAAATLS